MDEKRVQEIERKSVVVSKTYTAVKSDDLRDLIAAVRQRGEPMLKVVSGEIYTSNVPPGWTGHLYAAPPTVADALERAAKVCEDAANIVRERDLGAVADFGAGVADECAAAIRKLKEAKK